MVKTKNMGEHPLEAVVGKLFANQSQINRNQSKMDKNLSEMVKLHKAQEGKNREFAAGINSLKEDVGAIKSELAVLNGRGAFSENLKKRKETGPGISVAVASGEEEDGDQPEYVFSVDSNGRVNCPSCKKDLRVGYFRQHARKFCPGFKGLPLTISSRNVK